MDILNLQTLVHELEFKILDPKNIFSLERASTFCSFTEQIFRTAAFP